VQQSGRPGRRGPWFAALWLFFLLDPLLAGWRERDSVAGVVGIALTLVFGAVYLGLWFRLRSDPTRWSRSEDPRLPAVALGTLLLLGGLMVATLGQVGAGSAVYVAAAAVLLLPRPAAVGTVVTLAATLVVVGETVPGWGRSLDLAFTVAAAALAVYGVRALVERNAELLRAQEANAELLLENERTRFARDLHDILGHSLTVITVKAELAGRLVDVDSRRARTELADLERLAREALADVRHAVHGYRDLTLPGELARARAALEAAGVTADLPSSTEEVAGDLRELFAWTVREGVTNVVRHARAGRCRITLEPTAIEVADDGCGSDAAATSPGTGSGLHGLRERAAAVGASVVVHRGDPGYRLRVARTDGRPR